jgi:hypothetical protein
MRLQFPPEVQMSAIAVQQILEQIIQLPEGDRRLLEQRLAEMADVEWQRETDEARRTAHAKGLNQADIDQAIEQIRRPA